MTRPGIERGPNVTKHRSVTVASRERSDVERPEATVRCNECNDALEMACDAVAMARRLALVAQNALLNGDLRRVGALLQDLCDVTCARLARGPARASERR